MRNDIKVSVIMPVYNAAKTLHRAIDSVLMQTYKNIELIVIDGSSTDGTQEIVKSYGNKISYFLSEPDRGYGDALNKGINVATGDYSIILAGDDFFIPKGIENFIKNIDGEPDVWCGNMFVQKSPGIITRFKRAQSLEELDQGKVMAHPATFFKIQTLKECNGYDIKYKINCDTELIMRLYKSGAKFQVADKNIFVSVFVCGGMSVQAMQNDSISELAQTNDMEEVAIKYGMNGVRARKNRKKIIYRQKIVSILKYFFRGEIIYKILYVLDGQKPLTKKELVYYGLNNFEE